MIELTKAETERLLAKFNLGSKPIPKMTNIQAATLKVRAVWGEGLALSAEMLKSLWRKLHTQKSGAVLNRLEMNALGRVLFTEVAEGMHPLCQELDTFKAAVRLLTQHNDKQADLNFAKLYFRHFPNPETTVSGVYQSVQTWAKNHNPFPEPIALDYYSEYGPIQAAEKIQGNETVAEGVARISHGVIDANAMFTHYTWVESIPQYREKMRVASKSPKGFPSFIDHLKAEVLDEGNFCSPQHLLPFTKSLLGHFLDNPSEAPDMAIQHEILNFFESFLGDRKDAANSLRWQPIQRVVDGLFKHWAVGRKLNNVFSFTLEIIKQKHEYVAIRHWEDRRPFWLSYWRAGRIKACRLYAPSGKVREYLTQYQFKYPDVVEDLGVIKGRISTNMMLMMELDNNLVVTEFSDNGKLRIGHKNGDINTSRREVNWSNVMNYAKVEIAHNPNWKAKAHEEISELSGLRPPR